MNDMSSETKEKIIAASPDSIEYLLEREITGGERATIHRQQRDHRGIPCNAQTLIASSVGLRSSPDGFEWGYGGSGPFCSAHSILNAHLNLEHGEDASLAEAQDFKWDFIAKLPEAGGIITCKEIRAWFLGCRHKRKPGGIHHQEDLQTIADRIISRIDLRKSSGEGTMGIRDEIVGIICMTTIRCPACGKGLGTGLTPPGVAHGSRRFWCGHCGHEWFPNITGEDILKPDRTLQNQLRDPAMICSHAMRELAASRLDQIESLPIYAYPDPPDELLHAVDRTFEYGGQFIESTFTPEDARVPATVTLAYDAIPLIMQRLRAAGDGICEHIPSGTCTKCGNWFVGQHRCKEGGDCHADGKG